MMKAEYTRRLQWDLGRHMRPGTTFRAWLKAHCHQDTAIGDIARDIQEDVRSGCLRAISYESIRHHIMEEHSPCAEALTALAKAYRVFRKEVRP
jgi:hypothetical protein